MDAIGEVSDNVSKLLKTKLSIPPTPIRSIRKQKNRANSNIDDFYTVVDIPEMLDVFEVWRIVLDDEELNEVFVVLSAKCKLAGYKQAKWSDVKYRGFYSTVDEAINNIYGQLA